MHPCYCVWIIPERQRCSFFIAGWYVGIKFMTVKRNEANSVKQHRSQVDIELNLCPRGWPVPKIGRSTEPVSKTKPAQENQAAQRLRVPTKMSGRWSLPDAFSTKEEIRAQVVSRVGEKRSPAPIGFHRTASQERRKAVSCGRIASAVKIQSSAKTRYFRASESPTRRELTSER